MQTSPRESSWRLDSVREIHIADATCLLPERSDDKREQMRGIVASDIRGHLRQEERMLHGNKGWTAVCDKVRAWDGREAVGYPSYPPKCRRHSGLDSTSQARRVRKRIEPTCNRENPGRNARSGVRSILCSPLCIIPHLTRRTDLQKWLGELLRRKYARCFLRN
jgi:hypothetical protein